MERIFVSADLQDILKNYHVTDTMDFQEAFKEARKRGGRLSKIDAPRIIRKFLEEKAKISPEKMNEAVEKVMGIITKDGTLPVLLTASASEELTFASEDEALQYLADVLGKKVMIAGKEDAVVLSSEECPL
jgi:hypothetical protein